MRDLYENLNDPELLDDTPLGPLRVMEYADRVAVVLMNKHDASRPVRVLHFLEPGQNPLAAIYGRRHWESRAAIQLLRRHDDFADEAKDRQGRGQRDDFKNALKSYLDNHADGREAIVTLGGGDAAL